MEIPALVDLAVQSSCALVEVTGGEPLIHPETPTLVQALLERGFEVLIETNGSCDISVLPEKCKKIIDCKLPGSGMAEKHLRSNYEFLQPHDEIKFVVSDAADFEYAVREIKEYSLSERTGNLIFSPVWGRISFEELAQLVIDSKLNIRMQLQMHKIIWGDKKGV